MSRALAWRNPPDTLGREPLLRSRGWRRPSGDIPNTGQAVPVGCGGAGAVRQQHIARFKPRPQKPARSASTALADRVLLARLHMGSEVLKSAVDFEAVREDRLLLPDVP